MRISIHQDKLKKKEKTAAREKLLSLGSEKSTTRIRRSSLNREVNPSKDTCRLITRSVMRHPNDEVIAQLYVLHDKLKEQFESMSDEAIEWMLGGSSDASRGGFAPKKNEHGIVIKTAAEKFKAFLSEDPQTMSPKALMTRIESVTTAMAYRKIHANWVEPPFEPVTIEQKKMDEKINDMLKNSLQVPIGEVYSTRSEEFIHDSQDEGDNAIKVEQDDISSASDVDEEDRQPQHKTRALSFRRYVSDGRSSWVDLAHRQKIPCRANTSGTAALTLAAIDGLYRSGSTPSAWFQDDDNVRMLSGALVIATYDRGDFHTIAETATGIEHFLVERAKKTEPSLVNQPIEPREALISALDSLKSACSDQLPEGTSSHMSLKSAVAITIPDILSWTYPNTKIEQQEKYKVALSELRSKEEEVSPPLNKTVPG